MEFRAANPNLSYLQSVVKAGVETTAHGIHVHSGKAEMDQLFSGGGTFAMFETLWLILAAVSFGAITGHTGMIQRAVAR